MARPPHALLAAACVVAVAGSRRAAATAPSDSDVVYYFGDPQIGFGHSGWREDELRFAAAGNASHAAGASAVVIAGDLVNVWSNETLTGGFDAVWPAQFDQSRVHLIPGNHDIDSNARTLGGFQTQLAHYRNHFGVDYHSFTTQHATFLLINSESLILPHLGLNNSASATNPWVVNETERQWTWLESELAKAKAATPHTIVVSHHPPFLKSPTEAHLYWNWPMPERTRFLALMSQYGVHHVLCGHTHTTTARTVDGVSIYTVAGTARAFDANGCGYRVLRINATSVEQEYIRQSDPTLKQCVGNTVHPDFEDYPELRSRGSWADVRWLLDH